MSNEQEFERDDLIKELLEQYMPIIMRTKAAYYVKDLSDDDWVQEGMIVLNKCVHGFTPGRGVTFGSYFKQAFKHHIFSMLRKQAAVKRRAETTAISYEKVKQQKVPEFIDPRLRLGIEDVLSRLIVKEVLEDYPNYCSKKEMDILTRFLMNQTFEEISVELNRSKKEIRGIFNRALTKIRKELN